jgi:hypothetical protein
MSYCRLITSDIYLYHDVGGYIHCCFCNFDSEGYGTRLYTRSAAIEHVEAHIAAGDSVPDHVIPTLRAEIEQEGDAVT